MLASVACEVAVVTVDHGQARAYVAGEVEGVDAGTERKGGESVPESAYPIVKLSLPCVCVATNAWSAWPACSSV
jgi:hypothetical protein